MAVPRPVTARAGRFIAILEETFLQAGAEISSNVYVTLHGNKFYVFDAGGHPDLLPALEGIGVMAGDIGGVFLTHGHYDHVTGLPSICAASPVPVFINAKDIPLLRKTVEPALLSDLDGGRAALEQLGLRTVETPGHTPGSTCFFSEGDGTLISGDTVFPGGYFGRTDLEGGDDGDMVESLRTLSKLKVNLLLAGHGEPVPDGSRSISAALANALYFRG